ncbi:SlyX protein [Acidovorax sp. HMWF029]|uniref:SlyX family protein n=1 Tax=unclassified Acidovorax TaxID=2684926 RepID=UPI000D3C4A60|nr:MULTISPECIES: SlyX family protein [unclassified Acidovorax]MDH4419396.1 SlyX family protein [Acidovorax sp.]PTT21199.1 SlyX protein [Acidovorax sp. HMWF029]
MSDANDLANVLQRLEALEIKASFTEDLLDQLNMTIYQQQQLIDRLTHEVIQLRQQVPDAGANEPRNLRDELPPHY